MEKKISKVSITLVGVGNLGYHLAHALYHAGYQMVQVAGRSRDHVESLAVELGCRWTVRLTELVTDVDLVILAINDRVLETVIRQVDFGETLVVHTSGAVPLSVFTGHVKNYGVLYPLQTFSRGRIPDFKGLPFCIEACIPAHTEFLNDLVFSLTAIPVRIDSAQRAYLHLSAVFVNNFVNHLFGCAEEIMDKAMLPFSLLAPIMRETIAKAQNIGPSNAQTGPAVRNEENVIKKHLELLSFSPEMKKLYGVLTESIRINSI
ncbi:MAG: DUF2520 domain-containing protein [Chlorobi bacterium]|nr:DUF2520 domain-containing protein [Chlorobiota bacterium]